MLITGHCQLSYIQTQQHLAGNSDFYESNKQDWESSLLLETNWCVFGTCYRFVLLRRRRAPRPQGPQNLSPARTPNQSILTSTHWRVWEISGWTCLSWKTLVSYWFIFFLISILFLWLHFIHSGDHWLEGTEVIQDINKRLFVESNYIKMFFFQKMIWIFIILY